VLDPSPSNASTLACALERRPSSAARRPRVRPAFHAASVALLLAGCGGSSDPELPPGTDPPATAAAAARFLQQSTFGPSLASIAELEHLGYAQWFERQRTAPASRHRPALSKILSQTGEVSPRDRMERWWEVALEGDDQLRQRVAFALSQVFVVSDRFGPLYEDPVMTAEYYDVLVRNAFGSYRQLLEEVTLSPAMGLYLSMLKNRKPDPLFNIRPDENYAREVLQLFSIGLDRLAPDGTPLLDADDEPIATYDQEIVEGFAHVFTGWNYHGATDWEDAAPSFLPMEPWPQYHDTEPKLLLDGVVLPAGQSADEDLAQALDLIFAHTNVGPFLGRQLIQRLVTSNPSPAYVARVAAAFDDDGTGVRGNLWAVVRAILEDVEARTGHLADPEDFGKLREPILRHTALWRALEARAETGEYQVWNPEILYGEAPLRAPSVFNFYRPDYAPPGELADAGLVAPELQITTHSLITQATNVLGYFTFNGWEGNEDNEPETVLLDIALERQLAADPEQLLDHLDLLLMAGQMSAGMRDVLSDYLAMAPYEHPPVPAGTLRVVEAVHFIVTSPEGAVQR
jgi:uncharacterized protein (DUF1800 family)